MLTAMTMMISMSYILCCIELISSMALGHSLKNSSFRRTDDGYYWPTMHCTSKMQKVLTAGNENS